MRFEASKTYSEVLEEPSSHDIGGNFGEDSPLLLPLLGSIVVIIISCSISRSDRGIPQK
jgi:hypothetical protein